MNHFNPQNIELTKYLFYTGKGGVGKTSTHLYIKREPPTNYYLQKQVMKLNGLIKWMHMPMETLL